MALSLPGCIGPPGINARIDQAQSIAGHAGLETRTIATGRFNIQSYTRFSQDGEGPVHVYIGGDGRAWSGLHRISSNPTPTDPVALKLAARDPSGRVAFLARPCQFVPLEAEPACAPRAWTSDRYAADVIDAMNQAIDRLLETAGQGKTKRIGLIGFSGGGTVAALLASTRHDVDWLVTIAANLDHALWTDWHGDTPLTGSLNAADVAPKLRNLPQVHFVGGKDRTVPVEVVRSYLNRLGSPNRARLVVLPGHDHQCCWEENWIQLLQDAVGDLSSRWNKPGKLHTISAATLVARSPKPPCDQAWFGERRLA